MMLVRGAVPIAILFSISTSLLIVQAAHKPTDKLTYVYWRNATKRTLGSVVPRPKVIDYYKQNGYVSVFPEELKFVNLLGSHCMVVELALDRYKKNYLFDDVGPEIKDDADHATRQLRGHLDRVELVASGDEVGSFLCELMPHPDMDEAYNLTVVLDNSSANLYKVQLNARTSWGMLRALETLSQLIFSFKSDQDGQVSDSYGIKLVNIQDEPRFKHRGFMLDTARHYISMAKILELLDAMTFNKLNVFHWHLVDDQSFPLELSSYPELSKRSSFRPKMIYTKQDVHFIILYAAMRGIRVIPELDTPGHTYSLRHIPNVLSECYDPNTGKKNGDFGPVDPTKESAYKAVARLIGELNSLFVDPYFHAGGDEVDFDCWISSPEINNWMASHNMSGKYTELSNYYMNRLYQLVTKNNNNKTMIVWQEVFDMGAKLPKDTVISVWKYINDRPAYMAQLDTVVKAGYPAILSSCWYLNYIDYGQDWIKFYNCDPRAEPIRAQDQELILGGEICMWTEFVDDSNVVERTWPRASAAAERLWSPREANNTGEFLHRLEQHRCRLRSRNIHSEPVNGPGYC